MGQCLGLQAYTGAHCQAGHNLGAPQRVSARAKGPVPGKGFDCTAGPKGAEHQVEGNRHRMPKGATDRNLPGSGLLLGFCTVLSYCLALNTHTPNVMDLPRPLALSSSISRPHFTSPMLVEAPNPPAQKAVCLSSHVPSVQMLGPSSSCLKALCSEAGEERVQTHNFFKIFQF